ncbi:hypothetical protein [Xenophilus sp. Marseille-Q4582]|uniref:hypothetical protein n=1 Tax=Xenophilus sp. Marseille-Q4582 TaxID=2866600 RepID=UPI001CE45A99|nr:hypothetical protein [Xenophilus sp. Marseille-Q4582]
MRLRVEWAYIGILLIAPFLLFHGVLGAYWRADDPAILLHAVSSPGLSAFYDPLVWRKLSPSNLTPWLTLSFQLDHRLAGAAPAFFYAHQVIACAAVAVAAYVLARSWAPPLVAFLGGLLFLVGAPTASVAELLMTRHYLEGLLLALLALLAFLRALERRQLRWAWMGSLAYALAVTAKEVYVPLVLILLAVPRGGLRERLRMVWPFLIVAGLYVPWRGYMLGALLGGYAAQTGSPGSALVEIGHAALRLPALVLGPQWRVLGAALLVLLAIGVRRHLHFAALAGVVALAVLAPLIPLVRSPGITGPDRYLFVPWFVLCMGVTFLARIGWAHRQDARWAVLAPVLLCGVLAGFSLSYQHAERAVRAPVYREFEVQGRFIDQAQARQGMVPSDGLLAGYWYATGLLGLRAQAGAAGPVMLIRGFPQQAPVDVLFRYDAARQDMRPVEGALQPFIAQWTASDQSDPLVVDLRLYDAAASWKLGPYDQGQYFIVSESTGRYPIPREGRIKIVFDTLSFQIQHQSPEGRLTASPVLNVQPGGHVAWSRP